MALFRAAGTVGGYTLVSRVLGFARDVLVARYLGAGPVADAFFVAFKFPNFFRRLFAEGAFNAAFVPIYAGLVAGEGRAVARRFAEDALAVLLAILLVLTIAAEIAMPWVIRGLAPGFSGADFALAVELTRITFPYLLFISLVSLQGGVLNAIDRFAAVAATPVVMNLCMIGGLLALRDLTPTAGHALAWGVALAGVAQFAWLAIACGRAGLALRLPWPRLTARVRHLIRVMVPAAVGGAAIQVNLLIDVVLASLLPVGAISFLYYADRVYELPLAVIGIAIGTAILPLLSRQLRAGDDGAARATLERAVEWGLLFTMPAAAALWVLAAPIMVTLFVRGAFDAAAAQASATALCAYAAGLPAFVLIKIFAPAFYARGDTVTPMRIALAAVIANSLLGLALMWVFAHVGIALATSLSGWLNALLLGATLHRRGLWRPHRAVLIRLARMAVAALGMAAVLAGLEWQIAPWFLGPTPQRAVALALLVGAGLAVYGALVLALRAVTRADLAALRR